MIPLLILLQAHTPAIAKGADRISQGLPREVRQFLEFNLFKVKNFEITVFDIILILAIISLGRLLIIVVAGVLRRGFFRRNQVDQGRQEAVIQLVRYFIYTIVVIIGLEVAGVQLSILLAGSAALLVGVGLGLQQTFNDLVSGLILLFEGSINVGDIVELDNGLVGRVTDVGLRTSKLETRDSIGIIVPNSKFINNNIINWSHNRSLTRFIINVRVSYRNDPQKVENILLLSAREHSEVAQNPPPTVRLMDFGESGLMYELLFWTYSAWRIEYIKSEIRIAVFDRFRHEKIDIPYPQRDINLHFGWEELVERMINKNKGNSNEPGT
ncbi:mechanosensitive ion channel family protein [Telluribacter sp. SYSU D00476]|uniref:mechanosensitive ion channel family protein n=1 Tax=Telluribacter sp. SYSU D00476 TaxID=2811430 RepID=UPI001FF10395|nr:mechanosensitive ion channel domain-containing protein [Telluribacter sp. SYSU D00476]